MTCVLQFATAVWSLCLLPCCSSAYELQDTIHTLKEENLHLLQRLENLTQAVRDLKLLLTEHSSVSEGEHDSEYLHSWKEWTQQGISTETHQMLKQVFCVTEIHSAAQSIFITRLFLLPSTVLALLTQIVL